MDEVLVEEVVQASSAFDDFEDRNESDLEEDEDGDGDGEKWIEFPREKLFQVKKLFNRT